jgi:conjugal transfer pilus assembly protein TraE
MELKQHTKTINEMMTWVKYLRISNIFLLAIISLLILYLVFQNKIVVVQIPGGGGSLIESTYGKQTLDSGSQKAIILATVNAISQINSINYSYEKIFIQSFLAPEVFTNISNQIDFQVKRMTEQHELGSFYFEFKEYMFDPILNKHFVKGDIHTVNVVKNTSQSWVYEITMRVENYRPLITVLETYSGNEFHDSLWLENQKKLSL